MLDLNVRYIIEHIKTDLERLIKLLNYDGDTDLQYLHWSLNEALEDAESLLEHNKNQVENAINDRISKLNEINNFHDLIDFIMQQTLEAIEIVEYNIEGSENKNEK